MVIVSCCEQCLLSACSTHPALCVSFASSPQSLFLSLLLFYSHRVLSLCTCILHSCPFCFFPLLFTDFFSLVILSLLQLLLAALTLRLLLPPNSLLSSFAVLHNLIFKDAKKNLDKIQTYPSITIIYELRLEQIFHPQNLLHHMLVLSGLRWTVVTIHLLLLTMKPELSFSS